MNKFNRTIVLLGLMVLAGWMSYLMAVEDFDSEKVSYILGLVAGPVGAYIGVKGSNTQDN